MTVLFPSVRNQRPSLLPLRAAAAISLLLPFVCGPPARAQDAKTLFTMNCAACHLPDRQLVGPSLVEISKLYGNPKKLPEFLAWCKEPKQKRQGVIQMPPMAHVSDENLKLILGHIVEAAKGLKEVKVKGQDPFYASPSMRKRPNVMRIFMPEAGPAAIAVAVNDELHYCWDAGECRLRYIWKGDFIDGWPYWRGNGNGLAKIQGDIFLREKKSPLPVPADAQPEFLGYRIVNELPVFRYRLGDLEVTEEITPTPDGKALERSFIITSGPHPSQLHFTPSETVTYTSGDGSWKKAVLSLNTNQAGRYSVTILPK